MKRAAAFALGLVAFATACGSGGQTLDLAEQDLSRDALRGADLTGVDLVDTTWAELEWGRVDVEFLVAALDLTIDDIGERPGLDQMTASYDAFLGTDPVLGTGEEDLVFWMVSVELDSLARALEVEAFDAFRADAERWPDLVPGGTEQFRTRMDGLVSKSFHLRQALSIETGE